MGARSRRINLCHLQSVQQTLAQLREDFIKIFSLNDTSQSPKRVACAVRIAWPLTINWRDSSARGCARLSLHKQPRFILAYSCVDLLVIHSYSLTPSCKTLFVVNQIAHIHQMRYG